MTDEIPSVWTLNREAIERTIVLGRSARRVYTETDRVAIRYVLDRPDFENLSEEERAKAFSDKITGLTADTAALTQTAVRPMMPGVGWTLIIVSLIELAVVYFGYPTSIHHDADFTGSSYIPSGDTLNIGLLQNQLMLFLFGLTGLVGGIATIVAGIALARLADTGPPAE